MRTRVAILLLCCLATPGATSLATQRQVEHRGDVAADVRVEISNIAGSVRVTGWERNEVHVQATLGEGVERLSFDNQHDEVQIEVEVPRRRRNQERRDVGESYLEVSVPRGATLEIETLAASIVVEGVDGDVRLEASAGDITYAGASRRIEADSAAGNIEIDGAAEGAEIHVEGLAGQVLVQFVDADVSVTTVTGDARVIGGRLTAGDIESVSGMLYLESAIGRGAEVDLENFNGDIEVLIPEDTAADFDIRSYSGSIETEFGYQGQPAEQYSPEQTAEFRLGAGGASVDIETFAGSVRVRKR